MDSKAISEIMYFFSKPEIIAKELSVTQALQKFPEVFSLAVNEFAEVLVCE